MTAGLQPPGAACSDSQRLSAENTIMASELFAERARISDAEAACGRAAAGPRA